MEACHGVRRPGSWASGTQPSSVCWTPREWEERAVGKLVPINAENEPVEGLTCIPRRIHWPDTTDLIESDNELDRIAVDNFLETLADIALAVAKRKERVNS